MNCAGEMGEELATDETRIKRGFRDWIRVLDSIQGRKRSAFDPCLIRGQIPLATHPWHPSNPWSLLLRRHPSHPELISDRNRPPILKIDLDHLLAMHRIAVLFG